MPTPPISENPPIHSLLEAHARFKEWLFEHALPYWANVGSDAPGLGFREYLGLDGNPVAIPYKRLRVQARQTYVFSHASLLGWDGGSAAARSGFEFLSRTRRENGCWARTLSRDGAVIDAVADLYDLAFVLFAGAWYARASSDSSALSLVEATLGWIDAHMADASGGYANSHPPDAGYRLQNPHMHMLEAALALYGTSGKTEYLDTAETLVSLFRRRFFEPRSGTLGEYYRHDWRPADGDDGDRVEPGHHYEWVWLLDQYDRATGSDTRAEAAELYRFAESFGISPDMGVVIDEVGRDGHVRLASSRLWPQTEAIKANLVMLRRGNEAAGARIVNCVDSLLARYFVSLRAGCWTDTFDATGRATATRIPASSLYHIVMAFAELDQYVNDHRSDR